MSTTNIDTNQLNKNIEEYGFEAAMKWATQFPSEIHLDLQIAFSWKESKEGYEYWREVNENRKSNQPAPEPTPKEEVKEEPKVSTTAKTSNKVLPFEEEIQRRLDERKATNAKNAAIHAKAIELAEASRKKLEKKLKKLMADAEGVDVE